MSHPDDSARDNAATASDKAARRSRIIATSVVALAVLATSWALFAAQTFLLPIVLALLLTFLMRPLVRRLHRWRIPYTLGALLTVVAITACGTYLAYSLASPAATWMDRAPKDLQKLEMRLRSMRSSVGELQKATKQVEKLAQIVDGSDAQRTVQLERTSLTEVLLAGTWQLLSAIGLVLVITFFLLASGDQFPEKIVRVLPHEVEEVRAAEIIDTLESDISVYLVTVSSINIVLGILVGFAVWAAGLPNPALWGALATTANFVPYLGPTLGVAVVAAVGLVTFSDPLRALLPAFLYASINMVEAYLVTPTILGKRLTLNPSALLIGVIFWGWLWGVVGGLIAVPLLVSFKIICDRVPVLKPVGIFLGR